MVTRQAKKEKELLDQQTGLGYRENKAAHTINNANNGVRPVHFTSLFSGLKTVLI